MTVTYTAEVATCSRFGCFIKLLCRWRGSIYKIMWLDLLLFLFLYYAINMIYLHLLDDDSKKSFESIVYYCSSYTALIPLSFVLGFYVNLVMTRWWEQYITIPWPDSIAVFVSAHVHGQDAGSRVMRRTVMRYVCLCLTIVFTMISPCVKKRFPKLKNLVDAGLLLENEKNIIEDLDMSFPTYPKHWLPIVWAASIITRARKEGRIRDDFAVKTIIDELNTFRGLCGTLMYYDFICIPLVYTQVVTIAVYSFFICTVLAHQWTEVKKDTYEALDFYLPLFISLQFFFYMGWLKVAETLINPFGDDDDDFELNWMIDRNLQVSYLIVDEMHHEHPELVKDQYWDEVYPNELPYEAETKRDQPPEHSTARYNVGDNPAISIYNFFSHRASNLALNIRSQRFTRALYRFSSSSEESNKMDVEASLHSFSENVQRITAYTPSERSLAVDTLMDNTYETLAKTRLEPVFEEDEEEVYSEVVEEEELLVEEEAERIETQSSYESDTDSDSFERLREERLQQRYDRMNEYLERNFGSNFRIVQQPIIRPNTLKSNLKVEVRTTAEFHNNDKEKPQEVTFKDLAEESTIGPSITSIPINESHSSIISMDSNLRNILENIPISQSPSVMTNISNTNIRATRSEVREELESPASAIQQTRDRTTSPMGSIRSMSTGTSLESDEWEVVSSELGSK